MALYAEITTIEAPDEAAASSHVTVMVMIKNLYHDTIGIMVDGAVEYGDYMPYPGIYFPSEWANVPAYVTQSFVGFFTMPDENVTLRIRSRYYGDGDWNFDDEKIKTIEVAGVVGWYQADVWILSVDKGPALVEGWYQADVKTISIARGTALIEGWYQADVKTISIVRGPALIYGWYQADVRIISITRPQPPPPNGEEKEFPWGIVVAAAGGAIALAAVISLASKPREKIATPK